jgi:CRP-like cAMP-binding protein
MTNIIEEIESHILFRGITRKNAIAISKFSIEEDLKKGSYVFETGGPADAIYLILKGRVSVEMHEPVRGSLILESLTKGQLLGLSWLSQPSHWIFDAKCLDDISVIRIDAEKLGEFCDSHVDAGYIIMKNLSLLIRDRLQATRLQLMDIYATSREILRI